MAVLEKVNENFKSRITSASDGGRGAGRNQKEPFKGGLELWAQPRGKIFEGQPSATLGWRAIHGPCPHLRHSGLRPKPFYYFDEVDQNLDAYNAERIAKMCRERSKQLNSSWSPFERCRSNLPTIISASPTAVTVCSRRILTIRNGPSPSEAALKEAQKDADKNESRIMDAVSAEDMPRSSRTHGRSTKPRRLLPTYEATPNLPSRGFPRTCWSVRPR